MTLRSFSLFGLMAAAFLTACKDSTPIPHTPTHMVIVSGANQSADLSKPLDSALVVRVLDGGERPVAGVSLTWNVTGGGTVSAATTTTDADGKATVTWTLAPVTGVQVVTVTSTQILGASVSFVANNGATITGTITPAGGLPFGASFSRTAARLARLGVPPRTTTRRLSPDRIVVGFRNDVLGVAAAGATAYRSMTAARQTMTILQQRVASVSRGRPMSNAEISPAMLAARFKVDDTLQVDAVMAALRADPSVAWVERDGIVTIRDGAPRPVSAEALLHVRSVAGSASGPTASPLGIATKTPNDPNYYAQYWHTNMVDLPRAWSITTGSANVVVAVVDMGIRFDHPDVKANLTSDGYDFVSQIGFGTTETRCEGGTFTTIDGDGDGPDPDPTDPDDIEFDDVSGCWFHNTLGDHGLWTAGIIGAAGNDGVGGTGVNWTVHIRPVRVLGITGDGSNFDIAQGILYAAGLPATGANKALVQAPSRAQIINMSLGGDSSTTMANAVTAAYNAGSLIVASAGNDGLDIASYPAGFSNVMAVSAVGQDGTLTTYSNAGPLMSVAAPGGDFRFDDVGGGGVAGPGWNFSTNTATYLFGYGTSASAPFVSGVAALLLAQTPTLTNVQLRQRIEQFATRPPGVTRSDAYGWGIVDAYNSLTQQNGPPRQTLVRLLDATTGAVVRTITASNGGFAFTRIPQGTYFVQAGDDEAADTTIGVPGRRFAWAGGFGSPTIFNINGNSLSTAIVLGTPTEVEPNDDIAHANLLSVGSYVVGNITTPDASDMYRVTIAVAGQYTFETSGLVGTCGFGIELDTYLTVVSSTGASIGTNDDFRSATSQLCSRVRATLTPGVYYVTVSSSPLDNPPSRGRYRLEVRAGT